MVAFQFIQNARSTTPIRYTVTTKLLLKTILFTTCLSCKRTAQAEAMILVFYSHLNDSTQFLFKWEKSKIIDMAEDCRV